MKKNSIFKLQTLLCGVAIAVMLVLFASCGKNEPDIDTKPGSSTGTGSASKPGESVWFSFYDMKGTYVATDGSNDYIIITSHIGSFWKDNIIVNWGGKYTVCSEAEKLTYENGDYVLDGNLNLRFVDFNPDADGVETLKISNPERNQTKEFRKQATYNIGDVYNYEYEYKKFKKVVVDVYSATGVNKLIYSTVLYEGEPEAICHFSSIWLSSAKSNVEIKCTDESNNTYTKKWENVQVSDWQNLYWGLNKDVLDKIDNLVDIAGVWLANDGSGDWIMATSVNNPTELETNRVVCFWGNEFTDDGVPLFTKKDANTSHPYYELTGCVLPLQIKTYSHLPSCADTDYMVVYNPQKRETKTFMLQPNGSMGRIKFDLKGSWTIGLETYITVYRNGNPNDVIYEAYLGNYSSHAWTTPFWLGGVESSVRVTFRYPSPEKSCSYEWTNLSPQKNYMLIGEGTPQ